ncbi:hypothetical protein COV16_04090 [Candidatus Woesearchaeota archaeon CG10_big_fil_rev_8_21_14_0_10_34_8]|nr:MAG: hypothetical protein COV16_04090 [Candidatus Woesearchaeota archaeon CG10_big_fil_rev_8_21_14_0_10_34_8]
MADDKCKPTRKGIIVDGEQAVIVVTGTVYVESDKGTAILADRRSANPTHVSTDLDAKILGLLEYPEKFSLDYARAVVAEAEKYVTSGGAVRPSIAFLIEPKKGHSDVYNLTVHRSLGDQNILAGVWLNYQGVLIQAPEFELTEESLKRVAGNQENPILYVPNGTTVRVEERYLSGFIGRGHDIMMGVSYDNFGNGRAVVYDDEICWVRVDKGRSCREPVVLDPGRIMQARIDFPSIDIPVKYKGDIGSITGHYSVTVKRNEDYVTLTNHGSDILPLFVRKKEI